MRIRGWFLLLVVLMGCTASIQQPAAYAAPRPAALLANLTACFTYVVRPGDTLSHIGATFGEAWPTIAAANGIPNPNLIFPDQRLLICPTGGTPPPAPGWDPAHPHAIYHHAWFPDNGAPGQCVWYVERVRSDLNLVHAGNARDLTRSAALRGYHTGAIPAVGAIVVFQPGVQGANGVYGHAAMVVQVLGSGRFVVQAMAAPSLWVVSSSVHSTSWGVSFIYG